MLHVVQVAADCCLADELRDLLILQEELELVLQAGGGVEPLYELLAPGKCLHVCSVFSLFCAAQHNSAGFLSL